MFDRSILGYHIGWTCTTPDALRALHAAVAARKPDWAPDTAPVIRTDNGPQYTAQVWAEGVAALGMVYKRIPNATPNKNAHIESWHSVLEADCLGNHVLHTLAEAYAAVDRWVTFCNGRRMHRVWMIGRPQNFVKATRLLKPPLFKRGIQLAGTAPRIKAVHC